MRYLCTACNYIYNEDLGEKEDWIKAWTKFEDLKDNFVCPSCWELPEAFYGITEEVNYLWDSPKDALEAEHFINIEKLDEKEIRISVWFWEFHPTWEEHRITSIGIYDEYGDLVYKQFFMPAEEPILEFDVSDLWEYEIRAICSIHGVWGRKVK